MGCQDTPSNMTITLDSQERFKSFEFTKLFCGKELSDTALYADYCQDRSLQEIFTISYAQAIQDLQVVGEEQQFILYLEWDALRTAIAKYLGSDDTHIDSERCHIASVTHTTEGTEISQVILPPQDMPKIPSCNKL